MTDEQVRNKLSKLSRLARELAEEAKRRWPDSVLYDEEKGPFHTVIIGMDKKYHASGR